LVLPNTQAVINEPMAAATEAILRILIMIEQKCGSLVLLLFNKYSIRYLKVLES
jgi:hypothetical protein